MGTVYFNEDLQKMFLGICGKRVASGKPLNNSITAQFKRDF